MQQGSLKPSAEPPQLMYSTVLGAVERVALGRLAPGQDEAGRTRALPFPGSPRTGLGAGAGQEQWPWPSASLLTPGLALFPFGKGLLLHRHSEEMLPQQLSALLPTRRMRGRQTPEYQGMGGSNTSPWGAAPCINPGERGSCLFTGCSRTGWLQCLDTSSLMLQGLWELSPCMAPLSTRNPLWGVGRVGTDTASLRRLPAPQLPGPQPPLPHDHPFYRHSETLSLARLPNGELVLAPTGQCSACSISLTASVDFFSQGITPKVGQSCPDGHLGT